MLCAEALIVIYDSHQTRGCVCEILMPPLQQKPKMALTFYVGLKSSLELMLSVTILADFK